MEDLYYTPDISEFHSGFIYYKIVDDKYKRLVFKERHKIYMGCTYLKPDECGVKYLDAEDIRVAGWKRSKGFYTIHTKHYFESEGGKVLNSVFYKLYPLSNGEYKIVCKSKIIHSDEQVIEDFKVLFRGKIKNYNVLLNIMTYMGIGK